MFDLIIVGAGPSGSSAGRLAVRLGLETLLIEKKLFPRYKPCGGAVTEQAMSYLDFDLPEYICERSIFGGRLHFTAEMPTVGPQSKKAIL
jgi:flavin-dependent dehydrogenase